MGWEKGLFQPKGFMLNDYKYLEYCENGIVFFFMIIYDYFIDPHHAKDIL